MLYANDRVASWLRNCGNPAHFGPFIRHLIPLISADLVLARLNFYLLILNWTFLLVLFAK